MSVDEQTAYEHAMNRHEKPKTRETRANPPLSEQHHRDEGDELLVGYEQRERKWVKEASAA